jgi:hypothetical protein
MSGVSIPSSDRFSAMPLNNKMAYIADDLALRLEHIQQQLHDRQGGPGTPRRAQDEHSEFFHSRVHNAGGSPDDDHVQYGNLDYLDGSAPSQSRYESSGDKYNRRPDQGGETLNFGGRDPDTLFQVSASGQFPSDSVDNNASASKSNKHDVVSARSFPHPNNHRTA